MTELSNQKADEKKNNTQKTEQKNKGLPTKSGRP